MIVTVLIPYFQEAKNIYDTTYRVTEALKTAAIDDYEIIILNDGSEDLDSPLESQLVSLRGVTVAHLPHRGRYQARLTGIELAKSEQVVLCDSRVKLNSNTLKFFSDTSFDPSQPRNGHVLFDSKAKYWMVFWESVSRIVWSQVFSSEFSSGTITEANYNSWPKGTGLFYARKQDLLEAMNTLNSFFENDLMSSDDTLVLLNLAKSKSILYDGSFSATYLPRQTVFDFIKHMYDKGTKVIDSFGHAVSGISLILGGAAIAPPLLFVLLMTNDISILDILLVFLITFFSLEAIIGVLAIVKKLPSKFLCSLLIMFPIAAPIYLIGIYRGIILVARGFIGGKFIVKTDH